MERTIGFVGCGNMASAMIQGWVQAGIQGDQIIVSNRTPEKPIKIQQGFGVQIGSNLEVARSAKWVVLAVKPKDIESVLDEIRGQLTSGSIVVSLAAGVTLETLEKNLDPSTKILRMMPNTAAALNQGVIACVKGRNITSVDFNETEELFKKLGYFLPIEEKQMHGEIGLSGSAIAMFYLMADAMGDAGVTLGFTKAEAIRLAAATMSGAGAMMLQSQKHPIQLKDEVCSPGGTTIEMVRSLETTGFRNTVIEAVLAAAAKSKALSEK